MITKTSFFILLYVLSYVSSVEYLVLRQIDTVLKHDHLTRSYLDCIMGTLKCTPEAEKLKKGISETFKNGCVKCEQKQKQEVGKMMHHLMVHRPLWWHELESHFIHAHIQSMKHSHHEPHKFYHYDFLQKEGFIR